MTTVWADTNVLLRFLTGQPGPLAARSRRLLRRAAAGELSIRIANLCIAEIVWVLGSVYDTDTATIAEALRTLVVADGIVVEDADIVMNALRLMENASVDYTDAFVAASAIAHGEAVATFDRDFKRLGVELVG